MVMYMYDNGESNENEARIGTLDFGCNAFIARRMLLVYQAQLSYKYFHGYIHV